MESDNSLISNAAMPIHLIWGDDSASIENFINELVDKIVDPSWITINLSRLEGSDLAQASLALEEAQSIIKSKSAIS